MKTYAYRAINSVGETQFGRLDALNADDLEARLKHFGLDLISAKPTLRHRSKSLLLGNGFQHLQWFCKNLNLLLQHGVSFPEALKELKDLSPSGMIQEACTNLLEGIYGGQRLSTAFHRSSYIFDSVFITMIARGEEKGTVGLMLQKLSDYAGTLDRVTRLKRYLWFYPIAFFIILFTLFLAFIIFTPEVTFFRTDSGKVHWLFITAAILLIALSSIYTARKHWLRKALQWIGFHCSSHRRLGAFQFLTTFTMLYDAGVEPVEAVTVTHKMIPNHHMKNAIEQIKQQLLKGTRFDEALEQSSLFAPPIIRLIQFGQSQGRLKEMLEVVCDLLQQSLNRKIRQTRNIILGLGSLTLLFLILTGLISTAHFSGNILH